MSTRPTTLALDRTVALKFLSGEAVEEKESKQRFFYEAKAAAALNHTSICTIHEIDEVDGQPFIAMEYVEGESLRRKVQQRPLKLDEALEIAIQVGRGLQAAHEKGIVHRDIKSSNVMLTVLTACVSTGGKRISAGCKKNGSCCSGVLTKYSQVVENGFDKRREMFGLECQSTVSAAC